MAQVPLCVVSFVLVVLCVFVRTWNMSCSCQLCSNTLCSPSVPFAPPSFGGYFPVSVTETVTSLFLKNRERLRALNSPGASVPLSPSRQLLFQLGTDVLVPVQFEYRLDVPHSSWISLPVGRRLLPLLNLADGSHTLQVGMA